MSEQERQPVAPAIHREDSDDLAGQDAEGSARWDPASHLRLWLVAVLGLGADLWTKHWAFTHLPADPNRGHVVIPGLMSFHRSLNSGALFGLGKGYTFVFIIASILALAFVLFLFVNSSHRRWSLHIALGLVLAGALGNLYDRTFSQADVIHYTVNNQTRTIVGKVVERNERMLRVGSWPEGNRPDAHESHPIPILMEWNPTVKQMGVVRDFIRMEPRIGRMWLTEPIFKLFRVKGNSIDVWPWVFNIADALLVFGVGLLMINFWRERKPAEKSSRQSALGAQP
jgi:lipoprotein signal peptidase